MKLSNTPYTYIFSTINHVFQCFELDHEVISCAEAAHAKGFPLKNELKTLVLDTDMGLCTVNTTGDQQVSLRKVKNALKLSNVCMADSQKLSELNLVPGGICPFLEIIWNSTMLIDRSVFDLPFLSTNNGTRIKYIVFEPNLLLLSPKHIIGTYNKI